jgi:cobalt-zinc-cadmium efflux system outer membrane protein
VCLVALVAGVARPARAQTVGLPEALRLAQQHAPSVIEARGGVAVAESNRARARLVPVDNPYVEVQADRGNQTQDVAVTSFLMVPVELSGQRGARLAEVDQMVAWRRKSQGEVQSAVVGATVAAWGRARLSAARVAEAILGEKDATAQLESMKRRLNVGDVTLFERSLAESEVARWAQARAEAELALLAARRDLRQLTGSPTLEVASSDELVPPALSRPLDAEAVQKVVDGAPPVAALESERAYWSAFRQRANAEKMTPLNFIANVGRGDSGETRGGGGLSWTLPILRRNQGELARADAERGRVSELLQATRVRLSVALSSALEALDGTRAALAAHDKNALPAATRLVEAASETYRLGKTEYVHVFNARRELSTVRSRRLDLVDGAWRAYAEIAAILGELP